MYKPFNFCLNWLPGLPLEFIQFIFVDLWMTLINVRELLVIFCAQATPLEKKSVFLASDMLKIVGIYLIQNCSLGHNANL